MKKIHFYLLFLTRFFSRYSRFILGTLIIALILSLVAIKLAPPVFKATVTEGVVGTYTQSDLPPVVTHLLSQSLINIDASGKAQPGLVSGWQVNDDATVFTFKLKKDLFWSDGSPIKASDINVNLEGSEISYPDDSTIQVKISDSYSFLPELLDKPVFKKNTNFVGTGPYNLSGTLIDNKSNTFLTKVSLSSSRSDLPNVAVYFYSSEDIAKQAFKLGKVQSVLGLSNPQDLSTQPPFGVLSVSNHGQLVVVFYNTKDALLSDKNLRVALGSAAPSVKGEEEAKGPFPQSSWVFNPQIRDYLDNLDQAKTYLAKAGKKDKVVLTTTSALADIGNEIVDSWKGLGLNAELRVESGIPQNFQALLITQDIPLYPDQYLLWHSTQTQTNVSKYSSPQQLSPRVDKDLEEGRKLTNSDEQKNRYEDFQKALLDDSPATFLYFPKYNVVYQKKVLTQLNQILKMQLPVVFF